MLQMPGSGKTRSAATGSCITSWVRPCVLRQRPGEAAQAFSKSLDEDTEASGSLAELSKVLPAGKKAEIGRRFAQCQEPRTVFAAAMPILQDANDFEGMRNLLDAYRGRTESAGDQWATYYDAELKIVQKEYAKAEAELKTLLPLSAVNGQEIFASEYLQAARLAGHAVEAYGNVPTRWPDLRFLPKHLAIGHARPTLRRLVAVHLKHSSPSVGPFLRRGTAPRRRRI